MLEAAGHDLLGEIDGNELQSRCVLIPSTFPLGSKNGVLVHDEAIAGFKDAMKREKYDEVFHEQKREAFVRVRAVKEKLPVAIPRSEVGLR